MRTTPPFRADHVGSLLRPPKLLGAREDFSAGRISSEELRGVEDEAIREVVRMQEEVGLQSATDGEFRNEEGTIERRGSRSGNACRAPYLIGN
jgi:methionine synthase II (cobalamin-independent)